MPTETRTATAAANGSDPNTRPWTNLANIVAGDADALVQCGSLANGLVSAELLMTGFGFTTIPNDATVNGITATLRRRATNSGVVHDVTLRLLKAGAATGTNKADTAALWPNTVTAKSYGGAADLWGATLTAADVKASNFGLLLTCTKDAGTSTTAFVADVTLEVAYTEASGLTGMVTAIKRADGTLTYLTTSKKVS